MGLTYLLQAVLLWEYLGGSTISLPGFPADLLAAYPHIQAHSKKIKAIESVAEYFAANSIAPKA